MHTFFLRAGWAACLWQHSPLTGPETHGKRIHSVFLSCDSKATTTARLLTGARAACLEKRVRRVTTSSRASKSAEMSRPDFSRSKAFTLRRLLGDSCRRRCRGDGQEQKGGVGQRRRYGAANPNATCVPYSVPPAARCSPPLHPCIQSSAHGTTQVAPNDTGLGFCRVHRGLNGLRLHHCAEGIVRCLQAVTQRYWNAGPVPGKGRGHMQKAAS